MGIAQKLAAIMGEVDKVEKNGRNDFHKYSYATESDLVEAIRGSMSRHGVAFLPSVLSTHREGEITSAEMEFRFVDGDDDSTFTTKFWGYGQDKGEKGAYKAYTGAVKYCLMKTFLVPTGEADDPEHDGKTPTQPARTAEPPTKEAEGVCQDEDFILLYSAAEGNGWTRKEVNAHLKSLKYTKPSDVPVSAFSAILEKFSTPKPQEGG